MWTRLSVTRPPAFHHAHMGHGPSAATSGHVISLAWQIGWVIIQLADPPKPLLQPALDKQATCLLSSSKRQISEVSKPSQLLQGDRCLKSPQMTANGCLFTHTSHHDPISQLRPKICRKQSKDQRILCSHSHTPLTINSSPFYKIRK